MVNRFFETHAKKCGVTAAFFYLMFFVPNIMFAENLDLPKGNSVVESLINLAHEKQLHSSTIWKALLHLTNSAPNISDPHFLLSSEDFSTKNELEQTIRYLYEGKHDNVCRFPARYYYLKQTLDAPSLPLEKCPEVAEFKAKAPADKVSLIFASENLTHPASILGHSLLKLSGRTQNGNEISHIVSFYTDTDTYNFPKLFLETVLLGRKGYFALAPYSEKIKEYVDDEQRKVWEYKLDLDNFSKELITLHLLELKNSRLVYYFQKYNCATVIDMVLALSGKEQNKKRFLSTPGGVIKNAQSMGLIIGSTVITPNRWLIRELQDHVSIADRDEIRRVVEAGDIGFLATVENNDYDFKKVQLARAYSQYAFKNKLIDKDKFNTLITETNKITRDLYKDKHLVADNRNNPLNTPDSSQISIYGKTDSDNSAILVTFLPVSHTLMDNNIVYGHETELQFFGTTIKIPLQNQTPKIDRLNFYVVESLLPNDSLTGGISGRFSFAYEPHRNKHLDEKHAFAISGALGITKRFMFDIDVYLLGGGGAGLYRDDLYGYLTAKTGIVCREIWDMKTHVSFLSTAGQLSFESYYHTLQVQQVKYVDKAHSLHFEWKRIFNQSSTNNEFIFGFKKMF